MVVLVLLALMIMGGYGLYEYGRYRGGYDKVVVQLQFDEFKWRIEGLKQEIDYLKERNKLLIDQNAVLGRFSQIDRNAHDEVKAALNIAQQRSLELREELAFYRSLVSPSEMEPGLRIQSLITEASVEPATFSYALVLAQVSRNKGDAIGVALVRFSGSLNDKAVVYALSDVDEAVTGGLNFKFRYFQNFTGNIRFPRHFVPKSVSIDAKLESGNLKSVQKTFEWETTLTRN